jgi:hypothetical protein
MPLDPEKANPNYVYLDGKYAYGKNNFYDIKSPDGEFLMQGCNITSACHDAPVVANDTYECSVCNAPIVFYPYKDYL